MNYQKQAQDLAGKLGIKLTVKYDRYGKHFTDDKENRHIFKCRLSKGGNSYTFNFGQSIAEGNNEPTMYVVLACLQKYEVGSFEDFCSDFGYEQYNEETGRENQISKSVYRAVLKEWQAMERLFNSDELEQLQEIQ